MPDLPLLVNLLQLAVKDRTQLALENIALRHQLAVYKRSVKRPNINDGDRIFWLQLERKCLPRPRRAGSLLSSGFASFARECAVRQVTQRKPP